MNKIISFKVLCTIFNNNKKLIFSRLNNQQNKIKDMFFTSCSIKFIFQIKFINFMDEIRNTYK